MAAPVVVAAKKALGILASNKKERRFLGYTVGIALFFILLPVIVLYTLFGGLEDSGDFVLPMDQIIASMSDDERSQIEEIDIVCNRIAEAFSEKGFNEDDIQKAQEVYITLLIGKETDESFYENLIWCFENVDEEKSLEEYLAERFALISLQTVV